MKCTGCGKPISGNRRNNGFIMCDHCPDRSICKVTTWDKNQGPEIARSSTDKVLVWDTIQGNLVTTFVAPAWADLKKLERVKV